MKAAYLLTLTVASSLTALADFSYVSTVKSAGMMGGAGDSTQKHFLKGQKMKTDLGEMVIIMDFEAQTFTTITNSTKTYTVTKFSEMGQSLKDVNADVKGDVHETGQKKDINGFPSREVVMTMDTTMDAGGRGPQKITMETHIWISPAVPGAGELRSFYQRNAGKFPYTQIGARGNSGMAKAMTELQKKMFSMDGVPVLQIMKMKIPGMEEQMAKAQQAMEQMKKTNPDAAKQMEKAMGERMGGGSGIETTTESSGISTAGIPDSVFAIPAGYTLKAK